MLVFIVLASIFVTLFYYVAIRPMSHWKKLGIRQLDPVWLFGNSFKMSFGKESFAEVIDKVYSAFKDTRYTGSYQFTIPNLMIRDPDLIKQITVKDFDHFLDHRKFFSEEIDPLFSKNLFTLSGQKWRNMRSILSPSFTSSKMKMIFNIMSESVDGFMKHLLSRNENVINVEMKDILTRFANDIIASTAFGIKVDSLTQPQNEFYLMGKDVTNMSGFWRTLKLIGYLMASNVMIYLKISVFHKETTNFFVNLIKETIKIREEKNVVRTDMLQLLIEARKGKTKSNENETVDTGFATVQEFNSSNDDTIKKIELTDEDIAAQAMIFFFAGFDSVTTAMCFTAYELALNTDIQTKLREEIQENHALCNGKLTYETLMKMTYLDMVISESLRKWPPAVFTDRVCTKPYTIQPVLPEEKPLHLEKQSAITVPIYGIHRDPKYYPQPHKFDPERFNEENKSKIKPYTYMPFGLGPRNCIGSRFALMEIKILFYNLLLKFDIIPTKKTPVPPVINRGSFNMGLEGGFHMALRCREI